jgi:hypothetical protein
MTATVANISTILKVRYKDGVSYEGREMQTLLNVLPKATDFDGEALHIAVQTAGPRGASSDFAQAMASMKPSQFYKFIVTRTESFALARVRGQAMKAARNGGALLNLWENEINRATKTDMEHHAIMCHRNGTGSRARLRNSSAGAAAVTVTSASEWDANNFEIGDRVRASATDGGALLSTNAVEITAIDRINGTLTAAAAWDSVIPGLNEDDYLYRAGDEKNASTEVVPMGFDGWIVGGSAPGTLFSLNRNPDPVRLAGQSLSVSGLPMSEALVKGLAYLDIQGAKAPDLCLVHPADMAQLKVSLEGQKVYDGQIKGSTAGVSFKSVQIAGSRGPVDIMEDPYTQQGKCKITRKAAWKFHTLGPLSQIADFDDNQFLRVASDDAYEVRVATYGNMYTDRPLDSIVLTSFGVGV